MNVLGIETSCDETGVALYSTETGLVADALHSQVDLHAVYGGVVPEIASRDHVRKLIPLLDDCLVIVQAAKHHETTREGGTEALITSAVQLEQAAAVLVRPDPAVPLRFRVPVEGARTSESIQVFDGVPGVSIQNGAIVHRLHQAAAVKFRDILLVTQGQEQQGAVCQQKLLNRRASQFQDRSRIGCLQQIAGQRKQAHQCGSSRARQMCHD